MRSSRVSLPAVSGNPVFSPCPLRLCGVRLLTNWTAHLPEPDWGIEVCTLRITQRTLFVSLEGGLMRSILSWINFGRRISHRRLLHVDADDFHLPPNLRFLSQI